MQVSDKEKSHIHQTYRTLAPLNLMLSFIGLGFNLTYKMKPKNFWLIAKNVFRVSILAIIDTYTLVYKVTYLSDTVSPSIRYTDYLQVVYDFVQYVVDIFYVRKYGPVSAEYFKQYETIDRILASVNYCTITNKVLRLMGFFALLWISSSVCDFVAWVLSYGWSMASVYMLMYIFLLIKILTTLDLTSQILHIECRVRAIGNLLDSYCASTESYSPLLERNQKPDARRNADPHGSPSAHQQYVSPKTRRKESHVSHQELQWLSRCYLLLTEQAAFVNKMYGTRILLNSLSLLIDMVRFTNIAARILIGSQKTLYYSGYVPIVSSIMRLLTCAAVLMSLVTHCEKVYKQRDRILDTIYNLLIFKSPDEDLKTAASELRDLIQARPIDFTMANFFRLDYSLLASIASVIVTYTIILLQSIS